MKTITVLKQKSDNYGLKNQKLFQRYLSNCFKSQVSIMPAMSIPFSPKNLALTYAVLPGPIKNGKTSFNVAANDFDIRF